MATACWTVISRVARIAFFSLGSCVSVGLPSNDTARVECTRDRVENASVRVEYARVKV